MFERLKIFVKAQFSAFTGGVCDYFIMIFLTEVIGIHYTVSIAIGCSLGAVVNFSLNKRWAFYSKNMPYKFTFSQQLWRFIFVAASSIGLKMLGTYLFTTHTHIDYKITRIITDLLVSICFNYVLQRFWVFKDKRTSKKRVFQSPDFLQRN
ncbi:MAG: GtrA family protein [Prevotellaceae bacterium]|nr:GtrA family protein [Prevotellaceae bacterium]